MNINEFIDWWFQHTITLRTFWVCPPRQVGHGKLFTSEMLKFAPVTTSEIYMRVTTLEALPKKGRGGSDAAGEIPGLWLDIDFSDGNGKSKMYPTRDRLDDLLGQLPDASAIVETGGGVHAYWKFTKPVNTADASDMLECWWNKCNKIWQNAGYELDNVMDGARLMRLPGSINFKQNDFKTSWEINDLEYNVTDLVDNCDSIPKLKFERKWFDRPTIKTAYNQVIDVNKIWLDAGFKYVGKTSTDKGEGRNYVRPQAKSAKSLTVWDDSGVTTIFSSTVQTKMGLEEHVEPYTLAKTLNVLKDWDSQAELLLKQFKQQFSIVLDKARSGHDTTNERWHDAAQDELLVEKFFVSGSSKDDLVRPYPAHVLPKEFRHASEDIAKAVNAPLGMCYMLSTGAMMAAISGEVIVDLDETPVSNMIIASAPPGTGKSPVMNMFTKGLKDNDAINYRTWAPFSKRNQARLEQLEIEISKFEGDEESLDGINLRHRYEKAFRESKPPIRLYGKTTPAKLAEVLSYIGSAAIVSSEGSDWIDSFKDSAQGQASGEMLLKVHDADPDSKMTMSGGFLQVNSTLTVLLAVQTDKLHKFSGLADSGLWPRFYHADFSERVPPRRRSSDSNMTPESVSAFQELTMSMAITAIHDFPEKFDHAGNSDKGNLLDVSKEARDKYHEWEYYNAARRDEGDSEGVYDKRYNNPELIAALSKSHSHAVRFAGMFAMFRRINSPHDFTVHGEKFEVNVEDMAAGIALADWAYDRKVADSLIVTDDEEDGRRQYMLKVARSSDQYFTASTLIKSSSPYFHRNEKTKDVIKWLNEFVDAGLLVHHGARNKFALANRQ